MMIEMEQQHKTTIEAEKLQTLFDYIQNNEMGRLYKNVGGNKYHRYQHCIKNPEFYINIKTLKDLEEQLINGRLCTKCFGNVLED